jgi:hypothetical protein
LLSETHGAEFVNLFHFYTKINRFPRFFSPRRFRW